MLAGKTGSWPLLHFPLMVSVLVIWLRLDLPAQDLILFAASHTSVGFPAAIHPGLPQRLDK